ncbi:hypothetical protein P7K49_031205 [Saguinus oedipus]|uniref:Uncharacterized protein n=1 Tax=Saguinus oedipus TaxID=9490 RepID=A0ABQ9U4D6_SAGOE|nr:hypothetical protein P7K49_031205 [Saguinus oedipus]
MVPTYQTILILQRDVPFKQTSSIAVAGAVIGAVLALFIIAIFVTVLLTPRKKRPSYLDKMIDLPPTHKPPPVYEERSPPLPQKDLYQHELYVHCSMIPKSGKNSLVKMNHIPIGLCYKKIKKSKTVMP